MAELEETELANIDTDKLNKTVFRIWAGHPLKQGDRKWMGSAFAIGPRHCLTNKHVIEDCNGHPIYLQGSGLGSAQKVIECDLFPDRDIALVTFDPGAPALTHWYSLATESLASYEGHDTPLYSCGYASVDESAQHFNTKVSQINRDVTAYALEGFIKRGRSGGCLLNQQQQVVGVIYATDQEKNNHYAIAVDSFRDWLKQKAPTIFNTQSPSGSLTPIQQEALNALRIHQPIKPQQLTQLQAESITSITAYRLHRYALRSKDKKLDEKFVNLILLVDRGEDNEQGRFQREDQQVHPNLQSLIAHRNESAMVLIGRPGNGKTTLLRHLERQLCEQALQSPGPDLPLPFYLELNQFPPRKQPDMSPLDWLEQEWQKKYAALPPLLELMTQQPVLLLLDALNEMKIHPNQQEGTTRLWRDLLLQLQEHYPKTRSLFSCRTMDYSNALSDERDLPVPQIHFQELTNDIIIEYLIKHLGDTAGQELASALFNIPGLEIKTPYYLDLAVQYFKATGNIPSGSSQLIAAMIWLSLINEQNKREPSPLLKEFLSSHEIKLLNNDQRWKKHLHQIPMKGALLKGLVKLAWNMQKTSIGRKEVSKEWDEIIDVLSEVCSGDDDQADRLKTLAEQLDFLVPVEAGFSWKFSHQLLQEYLAAQQLVEDKDFKQLHKPWLKGAMLESLEETIAGLSVAAPLPPREASGWEETTFHAAAISSEPGEWIKQVEQQDLVLAARCAQHPEVSQQISNEQKQHLQRSLLELCQNPQADLRARMEAGLELGNLGDPRFEPIRGVEAEYIPPPLVAIPGGQYTIGSDGGEEWEKPIRDIELETFDIGQFPVTNAEWACFKSAGGYDDPRWWQTEQAMRWQRGELEQTENIDWYIKRYREIRDDFEGTCQRYQISKVEIEVYKSWLENWPTEEAFVSIVEEEFKPQQYRQPQEWLNPQFNTPSQPVVGVSWYEALAYCHWLSEQSGRHFTLPSEAQWRVVANGGKGARYPWGDEPQGVSTASPLANCEELHIRRTTPVGLFAEGASYHWPKPIFDLAGNQWEWTSSLYQYYPIENNDQRDDSESAGNRVICGGAWYGSTSLARAADRRYGRPAVRDYDVGFRVLCLPPSRSTDH